MRNRLCAESCAERAADRSRRSQPRERPQALGDASSARSERQMISKVLQLDQAEAEHQGAID